MDVNIDQKFHQRWEFRRNDDEIDSSSDDSKSNSTDDPANRRLQSVPVLTSPGDDQRWVDQRSQQRNRPHTNFQDTYINARNASGKSNEAGKRSRAEKGGIEPTRKGKAAAQKIYRNPTRSKKIPKKQHCSIQEPLHVEELRIFAESMITEIRTARENMLLQMKGELLKLVGVTRTDTVPCSKMNRERKTQKHHSVAVGQCSKNNKDVEERVLSGQALAIAAPDATESRERLLSPLQKPTELTQDSTQMIPTSFFTLPNVLPPLHLHPGSDLYFKNHLLPGIAANSMIEPEQLGYSFPIGSTHIGVFGDTRTNRLSGVSSGFPHIQYRATTNSLNVHSPMGLEDILRLNNKTGPRNNDGTVRFSH